ncbi:MAG TPA: hypothetical protein GXX37_12470 [Clostridiaceae bacterium]|nr:hypothetical protein [Clostridiaceae bacterium]
MYKRILERKVSINQDTENYRYEMPIELEYYLLENMASYNDKHREERVYGLRIAKKIGENCYEEKSIMNFSCNIDKTRKFINKLADNEVTPVTLEFIIEDMVDA